MVKKQKRQQRRLRLKGYTRVSSKEQEKQGLSPQAQKHAIEAYVAARKAAGMDIALLCTVDETGSARTGAERPVWDALKQEVMDGTIDGIVVFKLDRVSRSTVDGAGIMESFMDKGAALISVSEGFDLSSPTGRAMARMLLVFAELERENMKVRQAEGYAEAKRQGRAISKDPPYGYRIEVYRDKKYLQPVDHEQAVINEILHWHKEGWTPASITQYLNAKTNHRTRSGAEWQWVQISRILLHEGLRPHSGWKKLTEAK